MGSKKRAWEVGSVVALLLALIWAAVAVFVPAKLNEGLKESLELFNVEAVRPWIKRGADIRLKSRDGYTVAMIAANQNDPDLVERALKAGVDPNARTKRDRPR